MLTLMSMNRQKHWRVAVGGCTLLQPSSEMHCFNANVTFAFLSLPSSRAQRYFARTRDICCSAIGAVRQGGAVRHLKKSREGRSAGEGSWLARFKCDRQVCPIAFQVCLKGGWKQRAKCAFFCFVFGDLEQWFSTGRLGTHVFCPHHEVAT